MIIKVLDKPSFDAHMELKGITNENVEESDCFFISIMDTDPNEWLGEPYFKRNRFNVLTLTFDDTEKDKIVPIVGRGSVTMTAMTSEQAEILYKFIKKNLIRKHCIIHCTGGISRSGAVGKFINSLANPDSDTTFRELNPNIFPNIHVMKLLMNQASLDS